MVLVKDLSLFVRLSVMWLKFVRLCSVMLVVVCMVVVLGLVFVFMMVNGSVVIFGVYMWVKDLVVFVNLMLVRVLVRLGWLVRDVVDLGRVEMMSIVVFVVFLGN